MSTHRKLEIEVRELAQTNSVLELFCLCLAKENSESEKMKKIVTELTILVAEFNARSQVLLAANRRTERPKNPLTHLFDFG